MTAAARRPARRLAAKRQLFGICPVGHQRRNGLFSNTVAGANASANLCLLPETCKVNSGNGCQYLLPRCIDRRSC